VVVAGFNDLASLHPALAAEADGWDPETVGAGSNAKRGWKCALGHTWGARIPDRLKGNGCPYCNRRALLPGFNDLATERPDIAAEAHGWDPSTVMPRTSHRREWRCVEGHVWETNVAARTGGTGCPICVGKQVLPGYNDLATTHPEIATLAEGWDPTTVSMGSHLHRVFRCEQGHMYETEIAIKVRTPGCQVCAGNIALPGINDLGTLYPDIAAEAAGWDPTVVRPGSNKKVEWRCAKGHQWKAVIVNRTNLGQGCPVCAGKKVQPGYNDIATTHPKIAAQACGWDPTTVSFGTHAKKLWRCDEGHEWPATVKDRTAGYGCPTCAPSGYDPARDGYLYLLTNDERDMIQVGITNTPDIRLRSHGRGGWVPIDLRGPMDGALARTTEQAILKAVKARGAAMAPTTDTSQFDGWTEAWMRASLPVSQLRELLDFVYEDEAPI
jgi:hypothetical protein